MNPFRCFTLMMVNLLLVPFTLAQAETALSAGQPAWQGHLDEQGRAEARLLLRAGSYVRGTVSGVTRLDSLRASGEHERRLVERDEPAADAGWQFVSAEHGTLRLALAGPPGGAFRLTLERILTPEQQVRRPEPEASTAIRALRRQLEQGEGSEAFWRQVQRQGGTPLVEADGADNAIVTFLWRSARHNVFILGAPSGDHDPMYRLADSDTWYRSYRVPKQTLMSYRLAPDVPWIDAPAAEQRRAILATAQRDPLNPRAFPQPGVDRFQNSSMFALAEAPVVDAALLRPDDSERYLSQEILTSRVLDNRRRITLYRPPLRAAEPQRVLILFDGAEYRQRVAVVPLVHNLIAAGKLPPLTVVLIDNADDRDKELPPNEAFVRFLAEELTPWLQQRGIRAAARDVTVAGSSYGGLAASWAAFSHPELFGKVLSLSGSYWWAPPGEEPEWLGRRFSDAPRKAIEFYLEAGLFETRGVGGGLLGNNRHFRQILLAKGYSLHYEERASGHDYLSWRTGLAAGLIQLYGRP